jgi:hypothetical protein
VPSIPEPVTLGMLWLPILLSAVAVMIGSSIVWMALKYENADWKPVPREDELRDAVRALDLTAPGQYIFPHAMGEGGMEAAKRKMEEGPNGILLLRQPGRFSMGRQLLQAFVYYVVVSVFVAYVSCHALDSGADYLRVFQIAGASGFMAYGLALIPEAIWFGRTWRSVCKALLSGLIYGCLTAGVFGWLWPR